MALLLESHNRFFSDYYWQKIKILEQVKKLLLISPTLLCASETLYTTSAYKFHGTINNIPIMGEIISNIN